MSGQNWRISQTADDVFRAIDKRIGSQERRPAGTSVSDALGPGMSARAIQILDWNTEEVTFNGYYWSIPGALHAPDPSIPWTGHVVAKDDGSGLQQVWNVDPATGIATWMRTWVPNGEDEGVTFTEWRKFATSSGLIGFPEIDQPVLDDIQQALDDAASAMDFAVAANRVFRQPTAPVSDVDYTLRVNDVWFDTANGNEMRVWDGDSWESVDNTLLADLELATQQAQTDATAALNAAAAAQTDADAAATAAAQADADAATAQAAADLASAQALARNKVFRQTTAPVSDANYTLRTNDVWFDTDDGNKMHVWTGSAWTSNISSYLATTNGKVEFTPGGLIARDAGNVVTLFVNASDGSVTTKGDLTSGSTVTGAIVTGGTVQTETTANRGIKITSAGLTAYNASGAATLTVTAATGAVSMVGSLQAGSSITGGTVTGGVVQTETTTARGIKMNSTGLTAYNASGVATFTVTASTGAVSLLGTLQSGSSIAGATVTGVLQTNTAANTGIKISTSSLIAYGGGVATTSISATTGTITTSGSIFTGGEVNGSIVTGGTVQTETTTNRGIKMNSSGLTAYNSSGSPTFVLDAATGTVTSMAVQSGAISGSAIAARSITATQLLIGSRANVIPNPGFELPETVHTYLNGVSGARSTAAKRSGSWSLRNGNVPAFAAWTTAMLIGDASNTTSIDDEWYAEGWSRIGSVSGTSQVRIGVWEYDAAGSFLRNTVSDAITLTTAYQKMSVSKKITTTDTSYVVFGVQYNLTATSDVIYHDDLVLGQKSSGSLIVEGAINGQTITGATIQTAESGRRMVFSDRIRGYSGVSGELRPSVINISTEGEVYMEGGNFLGSMNPGSTISVAATGVSGGGVISSRIDITAPEFFYFYRPENTAWNNKSWGFRASNDGLEVANNVRTNAAGGTSGGFYDNVWTGGGGTAANINNAGRIIRGASSRRYKKDITPLTLEQARAVLALEPVTFRWRPEMEMGDRIQPGFIAEQAHDAGAGLWVTYTDDDASGGEPEGFRTAEITAALVALVKDLTDRVEVLEGV